MWGAHRGRSCPIQASARPLVLWYSEGINHRSFLPTFYLFVLTDLLVSSLLPHLGWAGAEEDASLTISLLFHLLS